MADLIYLQFVLNLALRATSGDERALNYFKRREFRLGVEAHLNSIKREIDGQPRVESDPEEFMHLIVDKTVEAKKGVIKSLRQWMRNSKSVDIVDPYLLSGDQNWKTRDIEKFASEFASMLPAGATVNLFVNGYRKDVKTLVWQKVKEGRVARLIQTNSYHDRFIITDDGVKLMGTSFNGLGKKISALIDLEDEDAAEIRSDIIRERTTGTKLAGPPF